ncbi:hypothetical protein HON49_01355 [archaeon]|nr:hypothetical protein [archaeon]
MKLYIITGNKHKVAEAKSVFSKFNIVIEQINDEKQEPKDNTIQEISELNAKFFFEKYNKPVIVDDTGVFFNAYKEFPGNHPKLMFNLLGYKGLLKLVENEDRSAQFRTAVTYYDGETFFSAIGELDCMIDTKIHDLDVDVLPYERIFLVDGRPLSKFSREDKNKISHRAKAVMEIAKKIQQEQQH